MVVMAAVHGVERVVLVMMMLMVMKAALWAQGLGIGRRGRGAVREGRGCRGQEDERTVTHVRPFGAGDVAAAVAARVSQGASRALRETWKLGRMKMVE